MHALCAVQCACLLKWMCGSVDVAWMYYHTYRQTDKVLAIDVCAISSFELPIPISHFESFSRPPLLFFFPRFFFFFKFIHPFNAIHFPLTCRLFPFRDQSSLEKKKDMNPFLSFSLPSLSLACLNRGLQTFTFPAVLSSQRTIDSIV